jgi:uncharacterized protein YjbI with pentapeptide repeats
VNIRGAARAAIDHEITGCHAAPSVIKSQLNLEFIRAMMGLAVLKPNKKPRDIRSVCMRDTVENAAAFFTPANARISTAALAIACLTLALGANPALASCGERPHDGVDWAGCNKKLLVLPGSDLKNAKMSETNLSSTDFRKAVMDGAVMNEANISQTSFKGASMIGVKAQKAFGIRTDFSGAILQDADLSYIELYRPIFWGSHMSGANLSKAGLSRAEFKDAKLAGADMSKSDAMRAVFDGADLTDTDFSYSVIARASFSGAKLDGSDWGKAFLYRIEIGDTDLSGVKNLTQDQIEEACGNENTKLPPGITPPDPWHCDD